MLIPRSCISVACHDPWSHTAIGKKDGSFGTPRLQAAYGLVQATLGSVGTHDPVTAFDPEAPEADVAPLAPVELPEVEVAPPDAVVPEVGAVPVEPPPVDAVPLDGAPPEAPLAPCEAPLAASAPLPGLPEPPASPFSAPFDEHANSAVTAHKQMRLGIRASELPWSVNGIRRGCPRFVSGSSRTPSRSLKSSAPRQTGRPWTRTTRLRTR